MQQEIAGVGVSTRGFSHGLPDCRALGLDSIPLKFRSSGGFKGATSAVPSLVGEATSAIGGVAGAAANAAAAGAKGLVGSSVRVEYSTSTAPLLTLVALVGMLL
jgi:hypothetical protein